MFNSVGSIFLILCAASLITVSSAFAGSAQDWVTGKLDTFLKLEKCPADSADAPGAPHPSINCPYGRNGGLESGLSNLSLTMTQEAEALWVAEAAKQYVKGLETAERRYAAFATALRDPNKANAEKEEELKELEAKAFLLANSEFNLREAKAKFRPELHCTTSDKACWEAEIKNFKPHVELAEQMRSVILSQAPLLFDPAFRSFIDVEKKRPDLFERAEEKPFDDVINPFVGTQSAFRNATIRAVENAQNDLRKKLKLFNNLAKDDEAAKLIARLRDVKHSKSLGEYWNEISGNDTRALTELMISVDPAKSQGAEALAPAKCRLKRYVAYDQLKGMAKEVAVIVPASIAAGVLTGGSGFAAASTAFIINMPFTLKRQKDCNVNYTAAVSGMNPAAVDALVDCDKSIAAEWLVNAAGSAYFSAPAVAKFLAARSAAKQRAASEALAPIEAESERTASVIDTPDFNPPRSKPRQIPTRARVTPTERKLPYEIQLPDDFGVTASQHEAMVVKQVDGKKVYEPLKLPIGADGATPEHLIRDLKNANPGKKIYLVNGKRLVAASNADEAIEGSMQFYSRKEIIEGISPKQAVREISPETYKVALQPEPIIASQVKTESGEVIRLITPQELKTLRKGTVLVNREGKTVTIGRDAIDTTAHGGYLEYGYKVDSSKPAKTLRDGALMLRNRRPESSL